MATNIPPHNLGEVVDGDLRQIDNPEITMRGTDDAHQGTGFPDRVHHPRHRGIEDYFGTGRGSVKVRGAPKWSRTREGREQIIITEIPYGVNRAVCVERIAELVNQKILPEISAMRDDPTRTPAS